jgi:hypothetical protein
VTQCRLIQTAGNKLTNFGTSAKKNSIFTKPKSCGAYENSLHIIKVSSSPVSSTNIPNLQMVVPWLRRLLASLSPRRPRFAPGSVHVGSAVDTVTLGQVSLRVLWLYPVSIMPPRLSILIYHLEDEQYARCWPQFRDIVSPHRHEQKRQTYRLPNVKYLPHTSVRSLVIRQPTIIAWFLSHATQMSIQ